jgi:hypothetical protein
MLTRVPPSTGRPCAGPRLQGRSRLDRLWGRRIGRRAQGTGLCGPRSPVTPPRGTAPSPPPPPHTAHRPPHAARCHHGTVIALRAGRDTVVGVEALRRTMKPHAALLAALSLGGCARTVGADVAAGYGATGLGARVAARAALGFGETERWSLAVLSARAAGGIDTDGAAVGAAAGARGARAPSSCGRSVGRGRDGRAPSRRGVGARAPRPTRRGCGGCVAPTTPGVGWQRPSSGRSSVSKRSTSTRAPGCG